VPGKSRPVILVAPEPVKKNDRFPFSPFQVNDPVIPDLEFLRGQTGSTSLHVFGQFEGRSREESVKGRHKDSDDDKEAQTVSQEFFHFFPSLFFLCGLSKKYHSPYERKKAVSTVLSVKIEIAWIPVMDRGRFLRCLSCLAIFVRLCNSEKRFHLITDS